MNYETRISQNRTRLEKVIPLCTPFVLFVDPCDTCNFQCKFCPNGDRKAMKQIPGRGHGPMTMETFTKIVDNVSDFPDKLKVLRLFKDGEPLMNKHLPEMIKYAKNKKIAESIDTTTNGSLLTRKMSDALIESGINQINISIEGTSSQEYKEFARYTLDFNIMYDNIKYLYENKGDCHLLIKINEDVISKESKQRFLDLFGPISDGISTEHVVSCWPTFDLKEVTPNDNVGIYGQPINEVLVCPYVFYSFAVNSDGAISVCFLDWKRELVIGNINDISLKEAWNGNAMKEYQTMFLSGVRKEHFFCGNCRQMSHGMPDNIDQYRDILLQKI